MPNDGVPTAEHGESAEAVNGAVFGNSFRPTEPWIGSTGFRSNFLRHETMRWSNSSRPAEDFLVNSRLRRGDVEFEASVGSYFTESSSLMVSLAGMEGRLGAHRIALPKSVPLKMGLSEAISRRRSVREFTGEPISFSYLATLLTSAAGITGAVEAGPHITLPVRATPSAGGLYPVDLLVAATSVADLERGIYSYDARGNSLWHSGDGAVVDSLMSCIAAPDSTIMTSKASAVILFIGRPWRSMRKYGDRGMRHTFTEAGMIAENIHLAAVALGVGSVDSASFYDDEVHEVLRLDGVFEALLHSIVIGIP